jgi:hypothetical protein
MLRKESEVSFRARADPSSSYHISKKVNPACKVATGRSAIFYAAVKLFNSGYRTVLLPTYVAEGVIDPFIRSGLSIEFYRLDKDLRPSLEHLELLLNSLGGKAVVFLIHYFGFLAHSEKLMILLTRFDLIVFDDFAHALFSTKKNGEAAFINSDVAIFSLNKFLPLADGAILMSSRTELDININQKSLRDFPEGALTAYKAHLHAVKEFYEADELEAATLAMEKTSNSYEKYYSYIKTDFELYRQSSYSENIEKYFECESLVKNRLRNSQIVYDNLNSNIFTLVHPVMPSGVVPWCLPVRVPKDLRANIRNYFFHNGVFFSVLDNKWNHVPNGLSQDFLVESSFLEEHLLVPISEFIDSSKMYKMVMLMNQISIGKEI